MKLTRKQIVIGLVILAVVVILFVWKPWKKKNGTATATSTDATSATEGRGRFASGIRYFGNAGSDPAIVNLARQIESLARQGKNEQSPEIKNLIATTNANLPVDRQVSTGITDPIRKEKRCCCNGFWVLGIQIYCKGQRTEACCEGASAS